MNLQTKVIMVKEKLFELDICLLNKISSTTVY